MKLYLRATDYNWYVKGPQGSFLIEIPDDQFNFNNVLKIRGDYFKACCSNKAEGWCEVEAIDLNLDEEAEELNEPQVICPICGYHFDEFDPDDGDEIECSNCGAIIEVETEISFSTCVKKLPTIQNIKIQDIKE